MVWQRAFQESIKCREEGRTVDLSKLGQWSRAESGTELHHRYINGLPATEPPRFQRWLKAVNFTTKDGGFVVDGTRQRHSC